MMLLKSRLLQRTLAGGSRSRQATLPRTVAVDDREETLDLDFKASEDGAQHLGGLGGPRWLEAEIQHTRRRLLTRPEDQLAKVAVEGDQDPVITPRTFQDREICGPRRQLLDVISVLSELLDAGQRDVLVGQEPHGDQG